LDIAIIGAGKWGVALDFAFSKKNKTVITSRRVRDLPNFVPIKEALEREYLVLVISAQHIDSWMRENFIDLNQNILVASKGIEIKSQRLLNQVLEEFIPSSRLAYLSGPSFASEVMKSLPTALVVSSTNESLAKAYADALPDFIKGYIDSDVIGAEVGGAYKNVIAIAGGVCDGLNLGNNAKASLISRGLVEMARFGVALGAKEATFLSLGGAGDLFLSANSPLSRNYRVGLGLAKEKSLNSILKELGEVAEGVGTTKALYEIAKSKDIYLPIAQEVYEMLFNNKKPRESLYSLLDRK